MEACGDGFVEEIIDKGTLKASATTLVHGEACSGDFYSQLKVDEVVLLRKIPMGELVVWGELRHGASCFYAYVVFCAIPFGHTLVGHVGDGEKELTNRLFCLLFALLSLRALLFEALHLSTKSLSGGFIATLHFLSDLLCQLLLLLQ